MSDFTVQDLKIRAREGGYVRGQEGLERILKAALTLLIEHGASALTMRRIAAECGLKAGNIAYYFASKEELLRELLDAIINSFEGAFDTIYQTPGATPDERLARVVTFIFEDANTKASARIFPELWAMSNHDPFVRDRVEEMYARGRVVLNDLIAEINPALPADERETLALFMSASMEGVGFFAGYERPASAKLPALERIAIKSFLHVVHTLQPGEISAGLKPGKRPRAT
ncbi:MAG: TetR family transcriptional regulator [Phenylobacterium sp.]|uniref:TetR/AcrR family transcriptional regulator n=1 Tax=Phenylobacterium sp. TaxID=1871053 RepID=UPI001A2D7869|nr:TetR/AcrR family transcriptional regulator [Phenylobacterium sp.]MBJ7408793.1 TetR family transcriptional regulator [Phenylobacterium sp.]